MKVPRPSLHLATGFAAAALSICSTSAAEHAIVISVDGMRHDAIEKLGTAGAPNIHRLIAEGATTGNARTDAAYTVTLPNHTSMITSRGVKGESGHNWTSNSSPKLGQMLHRNKKAYVRGMFGVAHDHGMSTALFVSKVKFALYDHSYNERSGQDDAIGEDNGRDKIDEFDFEADTEILVDNFIMALDTTPFGLSMLHFRDPDSAGHSKGWDLNEGSPYMKALQRVDGHIGKIIAAIEANEKLKGKTALIVTADHGGRFKTKTHIDASSPLNFTIPFYVWGAGVGAGLDLYKVNPATRADPGQVNPAYATEGLPPVRNGDAGNLALALLGLPAIEGSTINAEQDLKVAVPAP